MTFDVAVAAAVVVARNTLSQTFSVGENFPRPPTPPTPTSFPSPQTLL